MLVQLLSTVMSTRLVPPSVQLSQHYRKESSSISNVIQRLHQSDPKHDHEAVSQEEVIYVIIPTVADRFTTTPALQNQHVAEKWKDVDVIPIDNSMMKKLQYPTTIKLDLSYVEMCVNA
ncbi:hypothetical protein LIER_34127 [Lithospermum erythrorhizon]|uniref:Uncharacterized protein n=1 Tax=Lithospermum erythrorhizon TaxID=34254 RepID=A0AAV3S0V9_LITER